MAEIFGQRKRVIWLPTYTIDIYLFLKFFIFSDVTPFFIFLQYSLLPKFHEKLHHYYYNFQIFDPRFSFLLYYSLLLILREQDFISFHNCSFYLNYFYFKFFQLLFGSCDWCYWLKQFRYHIAPRLFPYYRLCAARFTYSISFLLTNVLSVLFTNIYTVRPSFKSWAFASVKLACDISQRPTEYVLEYLDCPKVFEGR